ncbi:MAG: mannitol-1-phosphate 5-dehydrogenase, partial [Clostridia bacterium]|nr:mannitol-1-phosphate 5-dehydrogenase [Clostridia bacterium]
MSCVIFGAGKIARGFIGHLLYLSNIDFTFVEKADVLADLINERKEYTVNVLGNSDKNCVVKNVRALKFSQSNRIAEAIAASDVVFNAVGGKNLEEIVPFMAKGIELKAKRGGYINFVTCENWKKPADILRNGISAII